MKLDFQVGTSKKSHEIMKRLSGKTDDKKEPANPKAPFKQMSNAYLFALVLGLSKGKKKPIEKKNRINVFQFSSVEGDNDFSILLQHLGEPSDLVDKDSARKAIEEYANWGLDSLGESKYGDDDYRIHKLLEEIGLGPMSSFVTD
tara:strand:+ start:54 stop:488 length:435 start_codon:yes stop_codon:yes gene_type:complete